MITIRNKEGLFNALNNKQDFKYGGHLVAYTRGDGSYHVVDYSALLLVLDKDNRVVYFDNSFYSVTTTKTQNLLKEVFCIDAPKRKLYLNDTTPKLALVSNLSSVNITFTSEGLISTISKKTENGYIFFKDSILPPLIALLIGGCYYDIETKLLRGED
ncbi:hypothetical protein VB002_00610 [Campylobacter concisus]